MAERDEKTWGLGWKGALAFASTTQRRVATCVLALFCITCILTQWGFVGFQFVDGNAAYLLYLLVPVTLATVLLGTLPGAGMGLFAGSMLSLHARLMPLDYFELTYVTPVTSIVMTGACAFVLGLLVSNVYERTTRGPRRALLVGLSCLTASAVLSAIFTLGVFVVSVAGPTSQVSDQAIALTLQTGNVAFQIVGDAITMTITTLLCFIAAERGMRKAGEVGLRGMFGARLSVAVLVAFLVTVTSAYGAITASELADSLDDMSSEVAYLLRQATHAAHYNGTVSEALRERSDSADEAKRQIEAITSENALPQLLEGYSEGIDGLVVLSEGDRVIASDVDRHQTGADTALGDLFDAEVLDAARASQEDGTLQRVVYLAPSTYNDLVEFALPGNDDVFASLLTYQVGYLMAATDDGYQVMLIRPSTMVFEGRDDVVKWIALSTLALLTATFALVWKLLDLMVARRVDATNETLRRITEGDLEARIMPEGAQEFFDLAAGINVTVDALQGWIAEAERRMDAELATAKAIQESALPSVFPPYPDIQRFDIYANMNAAKEVGGDFYDFFLLGDDSDPLAGKLAFVLADVSGKGVPAALFMMRAKTQIRDYLASGMELGEAVENANRQLCDGNDAGMFATAWIGVLDYGTGHIDFVNAGHNPPLLWHEGSWCWLRQKSGLPLGLFEGLPYRTHSLDCQIGDQLLVYTDGVTEAFSVDEEQYGEERLERLVNESFDLHPHALVDCVRASVAAHAQGAEQSDDITILALEIGVPPEEKVQIEVAANVDALIQVSDFIHAELDRRLCPVRAQEELDDALRELFINSCTYAYEGTDESVERYVRVTHAYSANPNSLTVEVIDGGKPFDLAAAVHATSPGKPSVATAKANVNDLHYARVDDTNVMTFVKSW